MGRNVPIHAIVDTDWSDDGTQFWYLSLIGEPEEVEIIQQELSQKEGILSLLHPKIRQLSNGQREQYLYAKTSIQSVAAYLKLIYHTG